jgi:ATP-dependent protease ClpP protease subunit
MMTKKQAGKRNPKNQTEVKTMSEILIYGAIDGWEITPQYVMEKLNEIPKDQTPVVRINSPGGSVFDGIAIYNLLKSRGVNTIVDGVAASIASIIFLAGQEREMSDGSVLMIHNPWTFAGGSADDLRTEADVLDTLKASLMSIYTTQTGLTEDEISGLMDAETWFNADQSIEKGFATKKAESKSQQVAKFNLTRFKNYPMDYKPKAQEVEVTEEEMKAKIDEAVASALDAQKAEFEKEKEQMKADFEASQKAEEDRQDAIRQNALPEQAEIVAKLIKEKTPLAEALQAINLDLRERMASASRTPQAQEAQALEAFRNSAPQPAQGAEVDKVDHKEVFNSIKNPVERAAYYEKHKNQIKGA